MNKGLERSSDNYVKVAGVLAKTAQKGFGINIEPSTKKSWEVTMSVIRLIDTQIDQENNPVKRQAIERQLTDFFEGDGQQTLDLHPLYYELRDEVRKLPERQQAYFCRAGRNIFEVSERLKCIKDPNEFAKLTRLEGQITSRLLLAFLPSLSQTNTQNIRKFTRWCTRLGRFGNLCDSFVDLPDDFRSGEITIQPSLNNRIKLATSGVGDFLEVIGLSPRSIFFDLLNRTKETLENNPNK